MSEKYARQIRQGYNKMLQSAIKEMSGYIEKASLRKRIKLAFNIVFRRKFEY